MLGQGETHGRLAPLVLCLDHPHSARARAHDNGIGGGSPPIVPYTLKQVAIRDPGGSKEDLLPGTEVVCVENLHHPRCL